MQNLFFTYLPTLFFMGRWAETHNLFLGLKYLLITDEG